MVSKLWSTIGFFLSLLAFALLVYVTIAIKAEAGQCLQSPLVYGVNELEKSASREAFCSCTIIGSNSLLHVTSKNMSLISIAIPMRDGLNVNTWNFSDVNISNSQSD